MAVDVSIDPRGFVRLTMSGSWPSLDELKNLRATLDAPGASPHLLADIRQVTGSLPHYDDIRAQVSRAADSQSSAKRRRAVVVASDLQFGIARVFQSLLPGEVEVFRDEAAALSWLASVPTPVNDPP